LAHIDGFALRTENRPPKIALEAGLAPWSNWNPLSALRNNRNNNSAGALLEIFLFESALTNQKLQSESIFSLELLCSSGKLSGTRDGTKFNSTAWTP
jgi:hypothetical protein